MDALPAPAISSLLRSVRQFLFPPACYVCNTPFPDGGPVVCARCWSAVARVDAGDPLYREALARVAASGVITDLVAAYYFEKEGVLQTILHQLKYQGLTRLGEVLGERLGAIVAQRPGVSPPITLLPVPLHRAKERERGYNQAAWICRGIAGVTGMEVEERVLRRVRYTRSQTGLHIDDRRLNMGGAFALHPAAPRDLHGRSFLLVDDVMTTGSTVDACAAVLAAHGAREIRAAVVALAR